VRGGSNSETHLTCVAFFLPNNEEFLRLTVLVNDERFQNIFI